MNGVPTIGRQPPHSVEAEEYLLSCCLLDGSDSIAKCLEKKVKVGLALHVVVCLQTLSVWSVRNMKIR